MNYKAIKHFQVNSISALQSSTIIETFSDANHFQSGKWLLKPSYTR